MNRLILTPTNVSCMLVVFALLFLLPPAAVRAQPFDCGSDGSDGALDFGPAPADPVVIEFDPASYPTPLDPDGDGVYNFTTITIPDKVTVKLRPDKVGWIPMHWLASGAVIVDGTIDLRGENGHQASVSVPGTPGMPGPAGHPGGWGRSNQLGIDQRGGFGPGDNRYGGKHPGNYYLRPLTGGSGGGGNGSDPGGGGGGGGGAILLASNVSISLSGNILCAGGDGGLDIAGGRGGNSGYGGAGGAVRIMSPDVSGTGTINARPGYSWWATGENGWVRIEALQDNFTGSTESSRVRRVTLVPEAPHILLPGVGPRARMVRIDGVDLPDSPTGSFEVPDVVVDASDPVLFEVEAHNIPLGTQLEILLWNETEYVISFQTSGLTGTFESSTATATHTIPSGLTRGFIYATWTNP